MTDALPKRRPIPKRVREAIDHYVSGRAKNITMAAKKAGLSREYLSRSLSLPHVAAFLRDKAARQVALGAGRASARLVELMDADSEHVSFDAAKHVAAIAGIRPASDAQLLNVSVDLRAGFVIDLSAPSGPARPGDIIKGGEVLAAVPAPASDEEIP